MNTRLRNVALVSTALMLNWAASASALEKTSRPAIDDSRDEWRGGTTCLISYYNICTGWVWVWAGFAPGDRVGTTATSCCGVNESAQISRVDVFWATGAPASYGFTGTLDFSAVDGNGCPTGSPIASQPMLPTSIWTTADFSSAPVTVPTDFVVTYAFGAGAGDPSAIASDHPAAGPTGPQACGSCFPLTRTNRSFLYGTTASPICPGSSFNDGICDAQLIIEVFADCVATSVDNSSWGQIKNLYR